MTEEQYEYILNSLRGGEYEAAFRFLWKQYNKLRARQIVYMSQQPPTINVYYDKPKPKKGKK